MESVVEPVRTGGALIFLFAVTGVTFFMISLPEISSTPPYISDVWFHVNNAHEFRDHSPMQDPRLAGEPFNYHVFGYAASAAASLVLHEPLAPLLTRYSGMSCAALLALNLFNVGRAFGRGSIAAGILCCLLVVFPLEIGPLFSSRLIFGATYPLYGVYLSTTTLAGFVFLGPLLVLIRWFYEGMRLRDGWILSILAFAGAGSKAMLGPVLLCGVMGVVGWKFLKERRLERRHCILVLLMAVGILPALVPLLLGDASYSQAVTRWEFADFASHMAFYEQFLEWGIPDWAARATWLFGFSTLILVGAVAASTYLRSARADSPYVTFAWMSLIAALVPSLMMKLLGASQLFFLYYANAILASIAGYGLVLLVKSRYALRVLAFLSVAWLTTQLLVGFDASLAIVGQKQNDIWLRPALWKDAVMNRNVQVPPHLLLELELSPYRRKLYLTPEIREGLDWARRHVPSDGVCIVNVYDASPYSAFCECRAYYETTRFNLRSHMTGRGSDSNLAYFAPRRTTITQWLRGEPDAVRRMSSIGITHLFVDRVNGVSVAKHAALPRPVFQNAAFEIYEVPPKDGENEPLR